MLVSNVHRYNENANKTTITYGRYSRASNDKYPTFSICFKGAQLNWYHEPSIYDTFGLTYLEYEKMIKGEKAFKYEYDPSLRLFKKVLTFMDNGTDTDFHKFHLSVSDFLVATRFDYIHANHSAFSWKYINGGTPDELPFRINYHSPEMICFTRNSSYVNNSIRLKDLLILNKDLMKNVIYKESEIQIFIHYPGQLIRSFDTPVFSSRFSEYQYDMLLKFKISESALVIDRPDHGLGCDITMSDYDMFLINYIVGKTKCTPPYWKKYVQGKVGLEECTSSEKLRDTHDYAIDWKQVIQKIKKPCIDMYDTVTWNWWDVNETISSDNVRIEFSYELQYYQELEYLSDLDVETLISNIGGFVGIFLGYSMMQIPELSGTFCNVL